MKIIYLGYLRWCRGRKWFSDRRAAI